MDITTNYSLEVLVGGGGGRGGSGGYKNVYQNVMKMTRNPTQGG